MLNKYNEFRQELLLESIINETILYYTPRFRNSLNKIDNKIAKDLLDAEITDIKPDVTFISLHPDKEGYLKFSTMKNVKKSIKSTGSYDHVEKEIDEVPAPDSDRNWSNVEARKNLIDAIYSGNYSELVDPIEKSMNLVKIGKFVNKIFPNKYSSQEIEEFVNKFKARYEQLGERLSIVEGDDIKFWYNASNYKSNLGQLGRSCMKSSPESFFEIYSENPEVCKMLILTEDDKLLGRALIWKLSNIRAHGKDFDSEYFMDRQYTVKDSDVEKFKNYAIEKGWIYKTYNNHHSFSNVTYKGEEFNADMVVELNYTDMEKFPYMDTFRRFDPNTGKLFNDEDGEDEDYILENTDGTYEIRRTGLWSQEEDRYIDEDEAVWSDWADSYLHVDNAIQVEYGDYRNQGWYPSSCEDLAFDEWKEEYIHVDDAIYSEYYNYYIFSGDAVTAVTNVYEDGSISESDYLHGSDDDVIYVGNESWYGILCDKFTDWDSNEYVHSDLLTKNTNGEAILNIFKVEAYQLEESMKDGEVEYVKKLHALALGKEINKNKSIIIDKFEYYENLNPIIDELKDALKFKLKEIEDELEGVGQLKIDFGEDEEYRQKLTKRKDYISNDIEEIEDGFFIKDKDD